MLQAALGPKAKPGPHTIFISKGGQKFAVGTLDTSRCTQFSCDITFSMDEVRPRQLAWPGQDADCSTQA